MQFQYTVKPSVSEHLPVQELRVRLREVSQFAYGKKQKHTAKTKTKLETKHEKTSTQEGMNAPEHVF